jgi:hypothetical protein
MIQNELDPFIENFTFHAYVSSPISAQRVIIEKELFQNMLEFYIELALLLDDQIESANVVRNEPYSFWKKRDVNMNAASTYVDLVFRARMSLTENSAKKKLEQAKALIADVFSSRVL